MTGKLYIDGADAYTGFGIFVTNGGYSELVAFPSLKNVKSNDWPEADGIEPDLLKPVLDTKEFRMNFASHRKNGMGTFFDLLSDGAYHVFDFREIGRAYRLRLSSQSALKVAGDMQIFSLQFADDFPVPENYVYAAPHSTVFSPSGYRLDGIDMSQYGVCLLQGTKAEILKSAAVKKNLTRSFANKHGVEYDGETVRYQAKDVTLNCLMQAYTLSEFWRNYDALLYDLARPDERTLSVDYTGLNHPYSCFYKTCKTKRFYPVDTIWFEFSLTLAFTSFRVNNLM